MTSWRLIFQHLFAQSMIEFDQEHDYETASEDDEMEESQTTAKPTISKNEALYISELSVYFCS